MSGYQFNFFRSKRQRTEESSVAEQGSTSRHEDKEQSNTETENSKPTQPSEGLQVWYDCSDAEVDICFIHGLSGDLNSTWTSRPEETPWPKALLPSRFPKARLLTYGYNAYVVRKSVATSNELLDHANNLLNDLTIDRVEANAVNRPLIFIAHSLGGLVCMEAIMRSEHPHDQHLKDIFNSTRAIAFMGTPHDGSEMANWAKIPVHALGYLKSVNTSLLEVLRTENQYLRSVGERFSLLMKNLDDPRQIAITSFVEDLPLKIGGQVVTRRSATFGNYNYMSIPANHIEMVKFVSAEDVGFKRLLGELRRWIREIVSGRPIETASHETVLHCLKSLAFQGMYDRFHDIAPATPGTCEWLTKHRTYCEWYDCPQGLLWIKGKPGAGKSTLLRHLLQQIRSRGNSGEQSIVLSFFFHGRGTELQKSELGLFRSLLHQLHGVPVALSEVVDTFQHYCKTHGAQGEGWQWHLGELRTYFSSALLKALESRPVWLYVDALDECGEVAAKQLVNDFESILDIHSTRDLRNLHICFTCRHYPIFKPSFKYEINVESENTTDISTFVQRELSSLFREGDNSILNSVTSRADGVFLWAWLVVKKVAQLQLNAASIEEMDKAVRDIPEKLDEIYSDIVHNMGPNSYKLLIWICFALRPLTVEEMAWAMQMRPDSRCDSLEEFRNSLEDQLDSKMMTRRVRASSGGLAEVTSDTNIVQFIHQSVKDFFIADGASVLANMTALVGVNSVQPNFVGMAHYWLSRFCIRSISIDEIVCDAVSAQGRGYPLLRYATASCLLHARESAKRGISQRDLLEYFSWPSQAFMHRWTELYRSISDTVPGRMILPGQSTPMAHFFLQNDLVDPVLMLIENKHWTNDVIHQVDKKSRTLLSIAARTCQVDVVQCLLEKGASVNQRDAEKRTPLNYAMSESNLCIIEQLLRLGGTIGDYTGSEFDFFYPYNKDHTGIAKLLLKYASNNAAISVFLFRVLYMAINRGMSDLVELLLTRNFDPERLRGKSNPALNVAARGGHSRIVQQLMSAGSDIYDRDMTGCTALIRAAQGGHRKVIQQLIDAGSDVNARDAGGNSALHRAARGGYSQAIQQLMAAGSDAHARNQSGSSALMLAAQGGFSKVAEQLIAVGLDVNARDDTDCSALMFAAQGGYIEVVEQLIAAGADVNAREVEGNSAVDFAAWDAHDKVVAQLTDAGAEFPADFSFPAAIRLNKGSTVNLLLRHGAAFDTPDNNGRTPLFHAAEAGFLQIVKLLLKSGANTNWTDLQGRTALFSAVESKVFAIVESLIENNATIDARDHHGQTALFSTVKKNALSIVELLAQNHATMHFQDISGQTALFLARSEPIAELLIKGGCEVGTMDNMGRTELSLAVEEGHAEVTHVLLRHGANIHSIDSQGRTLLSCALQSDRSEIMRQFLENNLDINHVDENGQTLLYHAVWNNAKSVVRLLLGRGLDINRLGKGQRTLLSEAAEEGNHSVVALLLDLGADANIPGPQRKAPLLWAAGRGHAKTVSELLQQDAAIDFTDDQGRTALAWASFQQKDEIVRLLIGVGANVNIADERGRTPLWYAYHKNSESESSNVIRQLLIDAGAETSVSPVAQSPGSWPSDSLNESEEE